MLLLWNDYGDDDGEIIVVVWWWRSGFWGTLIVTSLCVFVAKSSAGPSAIVVVVRCSLDVTVLAVYVTLVWGERFGCGFTYTVPTTIGTQLNLTLLCVRFCSLPLTQS